MQKILVNALPLLMLQAVCQPRLLKDWDIPDKCMYVLNCPGADIGRNAI